MTEETKKEEKIEETPKAEAEVKESVDAVKETPKEESKPAEEKKDEGDKSSKPPFKKDFRKNNRSGGFQKRKRRPMRKRDDRKPEFDQKIIGIRRVTRVMAGGRRFSFAVAMVIGDKKGRVGVGTGKASDTALAIQKAINNAKKNMVTVNRTEDNSIRHSIEAKYSASVIEIRPAKGRGLVAGASVRTVLELAGVTDVTSKIMTRSKNKINIARAAVEALKKLG